MGQYLNSDQEHDNVNDCRFLCFLVFPCCTSHSVSRFEDLLVLSSQLVQEGVRQLHTATPQLPCQTEGVISVKTLRPRLNLVTKNIIIGKERKQISNICWVQRHLTVGQRIERSACDVKSSEGGALSLSGPPTGEGGL